MTCVPQQSAQQSYKPFEPLLRFNHMKKFITPILPVILLGVALIFSSCKEEANQGQNEQNTPSIPLGPVDLTIDTLLNGLINPWGMDFLPDGRILFTQRNGTLSLLNTDGTSNRLSGLPQIISTGQGGLLDIALHPQFETNGWIYFSASAPGSGGFSTALFRAKLNGSSLSEVQKLFQSDPLSNSGVHFGNRIVFDTQGHLFLCFGDRGTPENSQNNANHAGTVVRLKDDGSIPQDNPFVGTAGVKPEIWSYGHRNPQGMVRHAETGELWLHEHGPRGGDEINIVVKGQNYGWPLASFGVNYNGTPVSNDTFVEGTILPVKYWVPSIAPCGMDFYLSDSIPQWKGNLFIGALVGQHLNMLEIQGQRVISETRLLEGFARFRCVRQGPDGYLYFLTENPGLMCRFRPENP
jgi:glucose/arabinose dehydrogenase